MAAWKRQAARNLPASKPNEDLESLYVFGYQCKLFRDDERAKHIDQGRHLIPWMGDATMMIDRYDGRGHLHDLKPYDAEHAPKATIELSAEEQRIEALCDEERYLELHTDIMQKAMYEEEELKRLNEAISDGYSAVGFNYDSSYAQEETATEQEEEKEEEEEPFYAPPELQLPKDVIPPSTLKLNAIIEKTALFVSKQGLQMEIVIKTKQKGNGQFEFLDYGTVLNPYYKHMVKMIKAGKYKPRSLQTERQNSTDESHHGYLHPSLMKKADPTPVVKEVTREEFMNSVAAKLPSGQIENTPYAKLLSNLSKHTGRNSPKPQSKSGGQKMPDSRDGTPPLHQHPGGLSQPHQQEYIGYDTYEYHYGSMPQGPVQPPVPGMEPVPLPGVPTGSAGPDPSQPPPPGTLPSGLGSEEMTYIDRLTGMPILPPPPDLQQVIDKMAVYVAKNGPEFEMVVRKKQDERFDFLKPEHPHNPYYEYKKTAYQQEYMETRAQESNKQEKEKAAGKIPHEDKHQNKSISFSLRSKDLENIPMGLRTTALLYESSGEEDEDEDTGDGANAITSSVAMSVSTTQPQVTQSVAVVQPPTTIPNIPQTTPTPSALQQIGQPGIVGQPGVIGQVVLTTEQRLQIIKQQILAAELEKKQAELRIKDKLAMAAREKLAQASKEEQIKAERKRKAAMFISMLKTSQPTDGPQKRDADDAAVQESVASVAPNSKCRRSMSRDVSPGHTRSPRRSPSIHRVSRSRSRSPRRRRSRSPLTVRKRSRSRSPRKRRKRSQTPPSAYNVSRRSVSPLRRSRVRSRSKTPLRYRRSQRSRSRSKARSRKSRSRSKTRGKSPSKKKRSRSRSKTRSRKKSRSRSRTRHRSRSKERRKRSRSRSKTRKSKSKKKARSASRSPRKRNKDKKSEKKSPKSKHSSPKKSSSKDSSHARDKKSTANGGTEEDKIIIHDDDGVSPIHEDGGIISDSNSSSGGNSPIKPHNQDVHIVGMSNVVVDLESSSTNVLKHTSPETSKVDIRNEMTERQLSPVSDTNTQTVSVEPPTTKPVNRPSIDMFAE